MQLFENGEIDYVQLSTSNYLKYEEDPRVLLAPYNSVRHVVVNTINPEKPILAKKVQTGPLLRSRQRKSREPDQTGSGRVYCSHHPYDGSEQKYHLP